LSRVANIIAPRVCDACEGGSGTLFNPAERSIAICHVCGGSGRAQPSTGAVIDLATVRAAKVEAEAEPETMAEAA
jgi:hypothetical protein